MKQQIDKFLLNRREVAELLGIDKLTVRRWGERGIITPIKLSERTIRYRSDEIMKMMKGSA